MTLMTLAKFEESWCGAFDVDGGARVVALEGETLEVAPEGVLKGGALKEAPDDGALEVGTEGGILDVALEG